MSLWRMIAAVGIALTCCRPIVAEAQQLPTIPDGVDVNAPPGPAPSLSPVCSHPAFAGMNFSRDYQPGSKDASRQIMGGTEIMRLIQHKGKLFAATGVWMDLPYPPRAAGDPPWVGPQVLVKEARSAPWRVDVSFPNGKVRINGMISATFVVDGAGNKLDPAVTLLIIDPAWSRDDATGKWTSSVLPRGMGNTRSFCLHQDAVTGLQYLFAGTATGMIFRGVYDPSARGRLRWNPTAELTGTGRIMCMAEANGTLYAAGGINNDRSLFSGGLFRRVDGNPPHWELLWRWPHVVRPTGDESEILRGLTAVLDPAGGGYQVLLGACAYPGVVYRIDPRKNYAVKTELDIRAYVAKVANGKTYNGPALSAYNNFLPVRNPVSGQQMHLFGIWVNARSSDPTLRLSAWFLERHLDGTYSHGRVYDPNYPGPNLPRGLLATRTIEVSPFPEDQGRVFYFGGYDCASIKSHDTAWIHRGTVPVASTTAHLPIP